MNWKSQGLDGGEMSDLPEIEGRRHGDAGAEEERRGGVETVAAPARRRTGAVLHGRCRLFVLTCRSPLPARGTRTGRSFHLGSDSSSTRITLSCQPNLT